MPINAAGWVRRRSEATGQTTQITDPDGRSIEQTDVYGSRTVVLWDSLGRPIKGVTHDRGLDLASDDAVRSGIRLWVTGPSGRGRVRHQVRLREPD